MTTAQDPQESSSWWAWFAHHYITLAVTFTGLVLARYLIDIRAIADLAAVVLIGVIVGSSASRRHTGLLCGYCLDRVPTDAAVQVQRRDWALRLHHWAVAHSSITLCAIAVFVVAETIVSATTNITVIGLAYGLVLWPWFVAEAWTQRFHDRVAPWCPYCRGGGGGGEGVESPTPVPTGTKTG